MNNPRFPTNPDVIISAALTSRLAGIKLISR